MFKTLKIKENEKKIDNIEDKPLNYKKESESSKYLFGVTYCGDCSHFDEINYHCNAKSIFLYPTDIACEENYNPY